MPRLFLLRHAKSDRSDGSMDDHDRPLAPRGRRAAPAMAAYMESEGLVPRIVLCSTATRARETWKLMADRLGKDATVIYDEELYGASRPEILQVLDRLDDEASPALVVGHNPGIEVTARALADSGDGEALERMNAKFPTAALAVLEVDQRTWTELEGGCCSLERFVTPKDLPKADELEL